MDTEVSVDMDIGCWVLEGTELTGRYVWRYILLLKSFTVYGLDIFVAVTMISSEHVRSRLFQSSLSRQLISSFHLTSRKKLTDSGQPL